MELPAPWDRPVLLARAGSGIPINVCAPPTPAGDRRGFLLFPPIEGETSGESYEDDGESEPETQRGFGSWRVGVSSEAGLLRISVERSGQFPGSHDELALILPASELRPVTVTGAQLLEDVNANGKRRLRVMPASPI